MRVIAGVAGGRKLVAPKSDATRPATDRVREAVFSSIGAWVENSNVADLYAGSGSFGLEALSRGASSALFVENARKALEALTENIRSIGLGGEVVNQSVGKFLEVSTHRFHLVFIDPPWPLPSEQVTAELALLDRLLEPGAEVIASRRHTDPAPTHPENWRVATDKRYGDTRILRYEKEIAEE